MTWAFGGADLSAETVRPICIDPEGNWVGAFDITLGDVYEWDKKDGIVDNFKQYGSALLSSAYDAAVYLEQYKGYKSFSHEVNFKVECSSSE